MTTFDTADRPLYPVDHSFVLQVRRDGCLTEGLVGRVEHLASGHVTTFDTVAALIGFITESIDAVAGLTRAPPDNR